MKTLQSLIFITITAFALAHPAYSLGYDVEPTCTLTKALNPGITSPGYEDGYTRPDAISEEVWNALSPYFLPIDCPEKAVLDEIFMKRNLLVGRQWLKSAGFHLYSRKTHKIAVARHPRLKGYLIKAYLEKSKTVEYEWWLKRIEGAEAIRNKIIEYGYEDIMKVPRKWIYPVPHYPDAAHREYPKYFILVVEDMNVLSLDCNKNAYKKKIDERTLDALFRLITELKLKESVYPFNTPFSEDGKLAFIDTEFALEDVQSIPWIVLKRALSRENMDHLNELLDAQRNISLSDQPSDDLIPEDEASNEE